MFGLRIWEWLENHVVQRAEERRVGADADGQRQHSYGGKAGIFLQQTHRAAQILQCILQHGASPCASDSVIQFLGPQTRGNLRHNGTLGGKNLRGERFAGWKLLQRMGQGRGLVATLFARRGVAILKELRQLLDDFRFARGAHLEPRQAFSNNVFPVHESATPLRADHRTKREESIRSATRAEDLHGLRAGLATSKRAMRWQ